MKASKYNLYLEEGGNYYIYNQLTSAFTQVDQELYISLKENNLESINRPFFFWYRRRITQVPFYMWQRLSRRKYNFTHEPRIPLWKTYGKSYCATDS